MADDPDIERLIGEVAQKHHVLLTRDDPVLVTVTLNEILLARALRRLTSAVDSADLRIAAGADRHIALAKEIAAQLINGAADYADKVIRDAAKDSADRIIETCRSQLAVEPKNEAAARGSHASAWSATIAAVGAAAVAAALVTIYPLIAGQVPTPERCNPSVNLSITHKCMNLCELCRHKNLESNESLVIPC